MASIHYILISRETSKILCHYLHYSHKLGNISDKVIKLLPLVESNHKKIISYDENYSIFYINDTVITVLCLADNKYPHESAFEFLSEIMLQFLNKYTKEDIKKSHTLSLDNQFKPILKEKMIYYNKNVDLKVNANVLRARDFMLETKNSLIETNELLLEKGQHMQSILKKADDLKENSKIYYNKAKKVKKSVKGYNFKWIGCAILILSLCYMLLIILCGGIYLPNCFVED